MDSGEQSSPLFFLWVVSEKFVFLPQSILAKIKTDGPMGYNWR